MRVIIQVVEAIEVFVPDLQTLGLIVPAFFGLYRSAVLLGLPETRDMGSALLISLALGYVSTVTLNFAGATTVPTRPTPVLSAHREPRRGGLARESQSEAVKTQPVPESIEIKQETDLLEGV